MCDRTALRAHSFARRSVILCLAVGLPIAGSTCQVGTEEVPYPDSQEIVASEQDVPVRNDTTTILLRDRIIDTTKPIPVVPTMLRASPTAGEQLFLIQFSGPVRDEWLNEVREQGRVQIVTYVPNNAYLIWTDGPTLKTLRALLPNRPFLQWMGDFHPAYRVDPVLQPMILGGPEGESTAPRDVAVTIQFVAHEGVDVSVDAVKAKAEEVIRDAWSTGLYRNLRVLVSKSALATIARLPDVVNMELWVEPTLFEERQGPTPGTAPGSTTPHETRNQAPTLT